MKIADYSSFISEFPYKQHSFKIKKEHWVNRIGEREQLKRIFGNNGYVYLNRKDLYEAKNNIQEFVYKVLLWGYPTVGRGKNIEKLLKEDSFEILCELLEGYRNSDISCEKLKKDIKSTAGLGLSTMTKFTHFLNTTIEGKKAIILDLQIIEAIREGSFEEFNSIQKINYENGANNYFEYISIIDEISTELKVEQDQIEMFLFTFGKTLK
jgi:hypothetical protein